MIRKYYKYIIGLIIFVSLSLSFVSGYDDVITVDELPHLGAGYSYWRTGKIFLNPEHPPLAKLVATLPIALMTNDDSAFSASYWREKDAHYLQYEFARQFLYGSPANDPDLLTQIARFAMLVFPLIALIIVAKWSYEIGGYQSSVISTAILGFSPTFLAHAKLITTDVPVASMVILALYCLKLFVGNHKSLKYQILAGLSLGGALLVKFSAILLLPVYLVVLFIFGYRKKKSGFFMSSLQIFAVAYLSVFATYFIFDFNTSPAEFLSYTQKILLYHKDDLIYYLTLPFTGLIIFKPALAYVLGFIQVFDHNKNGHVAYFLGEISARGSVWYFPIVFLIKETLAHVVLLFLAVFLTFRNFKEKIFEKTDLMILILWIAVYLVFSLSSDINIGIRHLLPIYPVIAILAGVILAHYVKNFNSQKIKYLVYCLFVIMFVEIFGAYPHYISFFNILGGGMNNGYKIVADSNVDWGQDLKRLALYLEKNNINKVELAYFSGWSDPNYYLKDKFIWLNDERYSSREDFIKNNSSDGYIAISVQFLQTNPQFAWLQKETPVAKAGYSIFVYKIK